MNNRFKFRVWSDKQKKMYYWSDIIKMTNFGYALFVDNRVLGEGLWFKQQSTGLKDKNGKLIYEGDIIKINTWLDKIVSDDFKYRYETEKGFALYEIYFNQEKARFEAMCIKYTKEKPYRCFLFDYVPTNHEVIGNIYENKELLNE